MCGPTCKSCWIALCGDCCSWDGCYHHDKACKDKVDKASKAKDLELQRLQAELGVLESERTYLYDLPVGVGDNCSSNRGERGGLFAMVEIIRRHEYQCLGDRDSSRR